MTIDAPRLLERQRQSLEPASGRVTGDAGVHDLVVKTPSLEPGLQQLHPSPLDLDTVTRAQGIPEHHHHRILVWLLLDLDPQSVYHVLTGEQQGDTQPDKRWESQREDGLLSFGQ